MNSRLFSLSVAGAFAVCALVSVAWGSPVPEGYPSSIGFTLSGTSGYDGTYTMSWIDSEYGSLYQGDWPEAGLYGSVGVDGAGQIDTGADVGGADFSGTFSGGAYVLGEVSYRGVLSGGSLSVPESGVGAVAMNFFFTLGTATLEHAAPPIISITTVAIILLLIAAVTAVVRRPLPDFARRH